jgi:L-ascorbate metabolism protein UlaG (beta-lactamase superfamily)
MEIKWLGHSCFLLKAVDGVKLLMDPFKSDSHLSYNPVTEKADVVTVSHEHFDHNYIAELTGKPEVLRGGIEKNINGIKVRGISLFHDESGGKQRGANTVFYVEIEDIHICHLGDLGHRLSQDQLAAVGKVDVLLIPVGGVFTIDVEAANQVCEDIKPHIAIPMHYRTDRCQFLQWNAEDFAKGKKIVKRLAGSGFEIARAGLPAEFEVVVPQYPA